MVAAEDLWRTVSEGGQMGRSQGRAERLHQSQGGTGAIANFGGRCVRGGRNATTQRVWAAPFVAIW